VVSLNEANHAVTVVFGCLFMTRFSCNVHAFVPFVVHAICLVHLAVTLLIMQNEHLQSPPFHE
jgi:hypothetical protein